MSFVNYIQCDQCGKTESFENNSLSMIASSMPPGWKSISGNGFNSRLNLCCLECLRHYADACIERDKGLTQEASASAESPTNWATATTLILNSLVELNNTEVTKCFTES